MVLNDCFGVVDVLSTGASPGQRFLRPLLRDIQIAVMIVVSAKGMTLTATAEFPLEEYDESEPTGVELEPEGEEFADIKRPWDPESIRVTTKAFSLRNILDLISEHSLDLAPDFQRLQVWNIKQKAQLIESILLQIPLPAFYFAEDADGSMRVIDGLQRLSTVHDFVRGGLDHSGGFGLRDLEYIGDVKDKRFGELPAVWQRRIFNTQIVVHVIDPSTPAPVKYDIFRRINTGGTPLNAQEIRHCMSKARSRSFLKGCIETEEFRTATSASLLRQRRMIDREVVLRFTAFKLLGDVHAYREKGPMEALLWSTTERLDNPRDLDDRTMDELAADLRKGLSHATLIFGNHAFRKWPMGADHLNPFNRALFETWTCALSGRATKVLTLHAPKIASSARERMTSDAAYIDSITASTGDVRRVEYRFRVVDEILDSAMR